jgi:hypothetical protein
VLVALALVSSAYPNVHAATAPDAMSECAPAEGLHFICGPVASEDLVHLPGTRWLITSGLNVGAPAHLYLIDARQKRATTIFPLDAPRMEVDRALTPNCSGPPDLTRMSTDGLALGPAPNGRHFLYAANHGDRFAIEMFEVNTRGELPQLRWLGCMLLPPHTLPNGVAALPDGGLLVTSFHDPQDEKKAWAQMARGENTGRLLEWHAASGFREVPGASVSGANGIDLSADASLVYLSAWATREIVVISRKGGTPPRRIPLDFLPDNIHRLPDGSLLVGGQRTDVQKIADCTAQCPQPWVVARVDPVSGAVHRVLEGPGTRAVNYACGGIVVDHTMFVTARGDRRVIYASVSELQ